MPQASKQVTAQATKPATSKQKPLTLQQRVDAIAKTASDLKVETPQQCVDASKVLRDAAVLRREITKTYKKKREPLVVEQRKIIAEENALTAVLKQAETSIGQMIKAVRDREAAERAAKEAAERAQREQAARDEAKLRAEQLRAAAAAAPSKAVARRLEAQATIVETAQPVIEPVETTAAPQMLADGVHTRKNVRAEVDSLKDLVLQVAAGIMMKEYAAAGMPMLRTFLEAFGPNAQATIKLLEPSMPQLNDLAKAFPSDLELRGVRVVEDETFVGRK